MILSLQVDVISVEMGFEKLLSNVMTALKEIHKGVHLIAPNLFLHGFVQEVVLLKLILAYPSQETEYLLATRHVMT